MISGIGDRGLIFGQMRLGCNYPVRRTFWYCHGYVMSAHLGLLGVLEEMPR